MSSKTQYKCSQCGHIVPKWQGKCLECDAWSSYQEIVDNKGTGSSQSISRSANIDPEKLSVLFDQIDKKQDRRVYPFSAKQLNIFFNKGLVTGSLTLLAGEPGLGKSTFALQILRSLKVADEKQKLRLLYITAEESSFELARRSRRLGIGKDDMSILQSNSLEHIEKTLGVHNPNIVVVDSIQTIFTSDSTSSPGSVSQVSMLAARLLAISKSRNISIILVGHVTKSGQIAGPKTLEHLVDSVLLLESSKNPKYRTLSFSKHRFGSVDELLLLKMESSGLQIVVDPSLALLENIEKGVGIVYGVAMDKNLVLLAEIQALVSNQKFPSGDGKSFGQRVVIGGLKPAKLNTILAIAEKYLNINLQNEDVYLQVSGLPKNCYDDSLDLPILLAIISSLKQKSIQDITKSKSDKISYSARLTLSGKIRSATNMEMRSRVAEKLGFLYNPKINNGDIDVSLSNLL